MEQLKSTELNSIFEVILHKYSSGLMIVGKLVCQQVDAQKEDLGVTTSSLFCGFASAFDLAATTLILVCDV